MVIIIVGLLILFNLKILLKNYKKTLALAILWIIYSYIRSFLSKDYSFLNQNIFFLIEYFFGSCVLATILIRFYNFGTLIKLIYYSILLQSFIIFSMILSSKIYRLFINLYSPKIRDYSIELNERYLGFRGFGFSSSITYDLGVLLSLGLFLGYYLYKEKLISFKFHLFGIVILMVSSTIVARTSFVVIIVFLIMIYYKRIFKIKSISFLLLISLFLFFNKNQLFNLISSNGYTKFIFELLINYETYGELNSPSTDGLIRMYDNNYNEMIFGTGNFTTPEGGYYGHTDVGFFRHLLFGGIPSILFLFIWYYRLLRNLPRLYFKKILLLMFLILFFIQFKGDILFGSGQIARFYFLLIFLFYGFYRKNYSH
jgi:hypothetical protein